MQQHELEAWLGPAIDDLTPEQTKRLRAEADAIDARYPDPDDLEEREAALSAALQLLLGETTPERLGHELMAARLAESRASAAAQQVATMLVRDGATEVAAAARCGLNRLTVRAALGKRQPAR